MRNVAKKPKNLRIWMQIKESSFHCENKSWSF